MQNLITSFPDNGQNKSGDIPRPDGLIYPEALIYNVSNKSII